MRSKDAEFVITVKEIKKKVLPELDDEFVKLVGNFASLNELRLSIKKSLEIEYQRSQLEDMHTQIIDSLNGQYDFCVPESLINKEAQRIKEQLRQRLMEARANEELIKEKIEKLTPSIKEDAAKNVKVYLIMNEIANAYSVEVSEEELAIRV
jgi:trigger factor